MSSNMKTTTSFLFASAFLFVTTLGIIRFTTENPIRTDEYAESDLRTMFALITADLQLRHRVGIEMPRGITRPDREFLFREHIRDPNNRWVDPETGMPYQWDVTGRFWDPAIELGSMRVMALEAVEETSAGGSTLRINMTVRVDSINIWSQVDCYGIWRNENIEIQEQYFMGSYTDVEIRYQTRIPLMRDGIRQILGRRVDRSTVVVNRLTAHTVVFTTGIMEELLDWYREVEIDGEHVDDLVTNVMSSILSQNVDAMDDLFQEIIGNRPYTAPQITLDIAAVNNSGFYCMKPSFRRKRETILFN